MYNSLFSIHQVLATGKPCSMSPCVHIDIDLSCSAPKTLLQQTKRCCRAQLPMEMVLYVFSFLEGDDLASSCHSVCRAWHICAKDESTWRRLYYNHEDVSLFKRITTCSWYEAGMWYLYCTKVSLYHNMMLKYLLNQLILTPFRVYPKLPFKF